MIIIIFVEFIDYLINLSALIVINNKAKNSKINYVGLDIKEYNYNYYTVHVCIVKTYQNQITNLDFYHGSL